LDCLTTHTSLSPIRCGFAPGFVNYKKRYTRLAAASDKVYQLLAHGRWFSPGTPASTTTKNGRHDIAEILLKVALKHQNSKSNLILQEVCHLYASYHDDDKRSDSSDLYDSSSSDSFDIRSECTKKVCC